MLSAFFSSRLQGEAPLETVFWRDMLLAGSALNIAATAAALGLFAGGYPAWLALAVNFLPVPYNAFLLVAVWTAAEREGGPPATTANVVGALWFLVMVAL
mgnify:CR=1 FL=1